MSSTFLAKAGSLERLKVRQRCGCTSQASQMRCTERRLMPTALAMALPVQWVAAPGGAFRQVIATTRAIVAGARGGFPGGRVLSRSRAAHAGPPRLPTGARPMPGWSVPAEH